MDGNPTASPEPVLEPGTRFAGRFTIESHIGAGPLGEVYHARSADGAVALRVFRAVLTDVPGLAPYLRSLAKQIGAIEHPGLARLFRLGMSEGRLYVAHAYGAGGSLAGRQVGRGPMPLDQALELVAALAPPLSALHAHGVLHGNLQPSNVVFDAGSNPLLTDPSLPGVIERAVRTLELGLTLDVPLFQAPEQTAGRGTDTRSDQYSLAAILFWLLTGAPPFQAGSLEALREIQFTQGVPRPTELNARIPEDVSEAVQRALSFSREQRFDALADFLQALGVSPATPLIAAPAPEAAPPVAAPAEVVAPVEPEEALPAISLPPLAVGERFGRFDIHELIGKTDLNLVYRATDRAARREVAVKILADEYAALPQFEKYFLSVVRRFRELEHPSLVPLLRAGKIEGRLFYSVGLMPGGTLQDRLAEGPLQVDEAIAVLQDIGPALSFLHQQGLYHLDIKPGNILFDEDGHARLSEAGLAPMLAAAAISFAAPAQRGTYDYQSPEQLAGRTRDRALDARSDVYALGVVLFHMLTGTTPYHADNARDLAVTQFSQPVPSARASRPDIDPGLDEALRVALSFDRGGRFGTVAEFMAAVTGLMPAEAPISDVVTALPLVAEPRPVSTLEMLEKLAPETVGQARIDELLAAARAPAAAMAAPVAVAPPIPAPRIAGLRWILAGALLALVFASVGVAGLIVTDTIRFGPAARNPSPARPGEVASIALAVTETTAPTATGTLFPTAVDTSTATPTSSPTPTPGPTAAEASPTPAAGGGALIETGDGIEGVLDESAISPGAQPAPPAGSVEVPDVVAAVVDEIITMLNQRREADGLPALVVDEPLAAAARNRTHDMVTRHYFSHMDPVSGEPLAFAEAARVGFDTGTYVGENLGRTLLGLAEAAPSLVDAWMKSPTHRANVLMSDFDFVGVGMAFDDTNGYWVVTSLFASKFAVARSSG